MNTEIKYNFAECFEKLAGVAHVVASERAAIDEIVSICRSLDATCVALAGLPESIVNEIEDSCADIKVLKEPYPAESLPGAIDEADVGVTGIAFAIAQSGTLVEISTNDVVRLVSGLPKAYIGVLHAVDIVNRFEEGSARIHDVVKQHDENLVISFISGPSRTGDIELKLTLGVHGPGEAHVVIIGNQSG
jgi:L-lactate dehydrogenase complex protein LldG